MSYNSLADGGLNYHPCRYGTSRLLFRGPRRRLDGPFIAAVGGTETYGKFVGRPWPALLEDGIGHPVVNFGAINAGVDVFCADETVLSACNDARAVVFQVMGAHNLSNRYYTVHPRRNDRFLKASALLRNQFPEIDFTEVHFTRHLIQTLAETDPARFSLVKAELQSAWVARMLAVLRRISVPVVLLWMGPRAPSEPEDLFRATDPLFVTDAMLDALHADVAALALAIPGAEALAAGSKGMVFSQLEAPAAAEVPNPAIHADTAAALAPALLPYL